MVCFDFPGVKRCERDRAWLSQPLPVAELSIRLIVAS